MSSQDRRKFNHEDSKNYVSGSYQSLANSVTTGFGLRRRSNVSRREQGGSADEAEKKQQGDGPNGIPHGFPKGLTPFFHINDNEELTEQPIAGYYTPPRSPVPSDDLEEQNIDVKLDLQREKSYNLVTEPMSDSFNHSGLSALSVDFGEMEEKNDPEGPEGYKSVGQNEFFSNQSDLDGGSETDADAMGREKSKAVTLLQKFQKSRRKVGKFINNEYIQLGIIFLIVVNALLMGLATMEWVKDNPSNAKIFESIDEWFLYIFTVEVSMQLYYYGPALFLDKWLVFDFSVVLMSWLFQGKGQALRAFRIFRAFRLITRVKPLRDLVLALGDVMPRLAAIFLLLVIIFYVFAVLFTELFSDVYIPGADGTDYFGSLEMSLFTCFQMMTMEWGHICRAVMDVDGDYYQYSWILFLAFVMLAGFIVFNLIVAVVVEAVSATEDTIRALDGIEDNSPSAQLDEAQERIDLLQMHLDEMMGQQQQIQFMLETMAGELLHMETERVKAQYRETQLKEEINRRILLQNQLEARNLGNRAKSEASMQGSGDEGSRGSVSKKKSIRNWTVKPPELDKSAKDTSMRESYSSGELYNRGRQSNSGSKRNNRFSNWTIDHTIGTGNSSKSLTDSSEPSSQSGGRMRDGRTRRQYQSQRNARFDLDKAKSARSLSDHVSQSDRGIRYGLPDAPSSAPTSRRKLDLDQRAKSKNWKSILAFPAV